MGFLPWEKWLPPYIFGPLMCIGSTASLIFSSDLAWWEYLLLSLGAAYGGFGSWAWFKHGLNVFSTDAQSSSEVRSTLHQSVRTRHSHGWFLLTLITLSTTAFIGIAAYAVLLVHSPQSNHNISSATLTAVLAGVALVHFTQVNSPHIITIRGALLLLRNAFIFLCALGMIDGGLYFFLHPNSASQQSGVVDTLLSASGVSNWVLFTSIAAWLMAWVAVACLVWSLLSKVLGSAKT